MRALDKIEQHFALSFDEIISQLHWEKKKSLLSLSKECNVSRDVFQRECKRRGLKLRNIQEATKLTNTSGELHWAFGLRKETHEWAKKSSERLKKKNPARDPLAKERRAVSISQTFQRKPWPQEVLMLEILQAIGLTPRCQYPIKEFVLDFFLADKNICIEVDTTSKWGKERRAKAAQRDKILLDLGIKTIRFNKDKLSIATVKDILLANNII
jgi:very-short-patch-repair endonuclease